MTVTIELSENLSIKIWPRVRRAAIITAFRTVNLSIDELLRAFKLAQRKR